MVKGVSQTIIDRQIALMGHLIRCTPDTPGRQVAIDRDLIRPQQLYKRVGHPREHWTETVVQYICEKFMGEQYEYLNLTQKDRINTMALNREF